MAQHARGMGKVYRSEGAVASPGHPAETKISTLAPVNGKRATKRFDREFVKAVLIDRAEDLFRDVWGEPERAAGREWRTKASNAVAMVMQGPNRGLWTDHRTGEGGDLFELIARQFCGLDHAKSDFPSVLTAAAAWAGLSPDANLNRETLRRRKADRDRVTQIKARAETDAKAALVELIKNHAEDAAESPAEAYLKRRGIEALPAQGLAYAPPLRPQKGLFNPHHAALIAWATDAAGTITGGQRILILADGSPAPEETRKPAFGAIQGHPARFPARIEGEPLYVAEGPESALSIWAATGAEVWAVFGSSGWQAAPLPMGRQIILCPDRDADGSPAQITFAKAVAHHVAAGLNIWIATTPEPEGSKADLNDTLQRAGIEAVREALDAAQDARPKPYHPAPEGDRAKAIAAHPATINAWADQNIPIMQATKAVARAYAEEIEHPNVDDPDRDRKQAEVAKIQRAIRRRIQDQFGLDYLPASEITKTAPITRVMLTGAQGVGKTRAVVGADRSPGILHRAQGLVSVLFEPDHGMAAQARRDYDKNAPKGSAPSIVLRGRPALDPDEPDETMCRLPDVAGKLAAKGVSVPKALCEYCPFAQVCGYLRQEKEIMALAAAPEGVAIFAPHDYAFLPLPSLIEPDLAIFDERPRDYGVEDAQVSFEMLGESLQFDRPPKNMNAMQATSEEADAQAANLRFIRPLMIALRNAGQDHPDRILGALRDQGVDQAHVVGAIAGLTYFQDRETARAMRNALEQYNFAQVSGRPFNLENRLETEIGNREGKIARSLQTIFEALLIEIEKSREDAVGIVVADVQRRPGSHEKAKGIIAVRTKTLRIGHVPLLHMDGTGDHGIAQRIFGRMDAAHHPVERSPADRGDRIVQVVKQGEKAHRAFNNASLQGGPKGQGDKITPYHGTWATRSDSQRADILKAIKARPGALVIGNKSVIRVLKPEDHGAHAAHFGAIRGRNDWEKVDRIMIIGREEPSPVKVERIARAFAAHDDDAFESLAGKPYPKAQRRIRKRDGSGHGIAVNFHPNAWADRVLKQIRDAEIVQAVDRIRPIFKDQPIEITLLSPVAVDLTVDQVIAWKDWRKGGTRIERALEQARVVPLSAREAARLLPAIWADKRSADRDLKSDLLLGQTVNKTFYLQNAPIRIGTVAAYRAEAERGKRAHEHKALIAAPPDQARAVLEALTGPLRHFEVIEVIEADPAAVEAAEAREERIAIIIHDGGLSEAEAIRVADGLDVPDRVPVKPPDPDREHTPVVVREVIPRRAQI